MRHVSLSVLFILSVSSSCLAQSHMGSPQEQAACRRDASRFCRQQLAELCGILSLPIPHHPGARFGAFADREPRRAAFGHLRSPYLSAAASEAGMTLVLVSG